MSFFGETRLPSVTSRAFCGEEEARDVARAVFILAGDGVADLGDLEPLPGASTLGFALRP
jgi:hypothetical protein